MGLIVFNSNFHTVITTLDAHLFSLLIKEFRTSSPTREGSKWMVKNYS